jgi:hypothetical protein
MQTQKRYSVPGSFRGLIAAVINRALADLEKGSTAIRTSPAVKDEAMCWINSPDCEEYCLVLDVDYRTIREQAVALYRRFLENEDTSKRRRNKNGKKTAVHSLPGLVMKKPPAGPRTCPATETARYSISTRSARMDPT